MFIQSLTPFYQTIQPLWADLRLSKSTVFKQPEKNSLASNIAASIDYQRRDAVIPVSVQVQARTQNLATVVGGAVNNNAYGTSRSQTIENYLEGASDVIDQMEALREEAADPGVSAGDRRQMNTDLQGLLAKFDDYYANGYYGNDHVLQGGSYSVAVGIDGEATTFNNGNLDREALGLVDLDISTTQGAAAVESILAGAKSSIAGQVLGVQSNLAVFNSYETADNSYQGVAEVAETTGLEANSVYGTVQQVLEEIANSMNSSIPSQALNIDSLVIDTLLSQTAAASMPSPSPKTTQQAEESSQASSKPTVKTETASSKGKASNSISSASAASVSSAGASSSSTVSSAAASH